MSRYIRVFRPRCKKCGDRTGEVNAGNMEVVGATRSGQGVVMRCRDCGTTTTRYSRSARREYTRMLQGRMPD